MTQELNLADLTKLYLNEHHYLLVESDPDTFNELLDFYSVVEIAAMVRYISDLPTEFTQIAQRNLFNAEFREYYELHCSALLPNLLHSRLTGAFSLYEEQVTDQVSIHHLFAEFIGLAMRVRHDDTIQIFREFISHRQVDGFDLNDVGIILRDPADCAERLIKPVEQRTALDQAVCGLKEFVRFAIEFDDLLTRCSGHRLFQSAQFHCFAPWFDIGTLARTWIHNAMLQVAKWQGNAEVANEFQPAEDRQGYFAAVQDAMERLFSSEYGGPLRNVAANIFSRQQIDRVGVKRIIYIAGDEAKRLDYGKHKTGLVMSVSQQRLWFMHQLDPTDVAYTRSVALRLVGELNVDVLQRSISEVVGRHEVLRARFQYHDGTPTMVVATELPARADEIDLRDVPESRREERTNKLFSDIIRQPFDLAFGLPFRAKLIQNKDREYILLFVLHEIICDTWSLQLLLNEIRQLYESFCLGQESPLPELPIEYSDFSRWQQEWLTGRVARQQLSYWQSQLDKVAELQLPTDRPHSGMVTREACTVEKLMNREVAIRMRALSRREGATVFMIGLAVVNILLSRYSGQRDITIGIDVVNRHSSETEGLIGLFANTLVLRTYLGTNLTFRELVAAVRRQTLDAYVHQEVPFEHVVEALQPERHLRRSPLFQVKFGLNIGHHTNFTMGEVEGELLQPASQTAKVDLEFFLTEDKDDFICSVVYATELFETATINRILMHWLHLSEQSVAEYEKRVCDLQILSFEEIQQIWVEWNRTTSPYPQSTIHRLFEHQGPSDSACNCNQMRRSGANI